MFGDSLLNFGFSNILDLEFNRLMINFMFRNRDYD